MSGFQFNGSADEQRSIARFNALRDRALRSEFEAEAETARQLAAKLRSVANAATLRAYVPRSASVRLSSPDTFVVLVNDVPWWRGQLVMLCAAFAGFEDCGNSWAWNEQERDYEAVLVGPPGPVLEARITYAVASLGIMARVPLHFCNDRNVDLLHAWIWGVLSSVQDELNAIKRERADAKARIAREESRNRFAMVHVPREEPIEGKFEEQEPQATPVGDAAAPPGESPALGALFEEITESRSEVSAFRMGRSTRDIVRPFLCGRPKIMAAGLAPAAWKTMALAWEIDRHVRKF